MGWAWGSSYGGMVGSDAVFAYPCSSCASGAAASAVQMAGYFPADFTAPTASITQKKAALLANGDLALTFETPWTGGQALSFMYGRGTFIPGMQGLAQLGPHDYHPVLASVSSSGVMTSR